MSLIQIIITSFTFQVALSLILDRQGLNAGKHIVCALILFLYFFILPGYFLPDNPDNEPNCAMPAVAITLGFWIFGDGITLFTHLVYLIIKNWKRDIQ